MRNRLFFLIFLTLILTASILASLRAYFQHQERLGVVTSLLEAEMDSLEGFLTNLNQFPEAGEWLDLVGQALTSESFDLAMIFQSPGGEKMILGCPGSFCEDFPGSHPHLASLEKSLVVAGEPLGVQLVRRQEPFFLYGPKLTRTWWSYTVLGLGLIFVGASWLTLYFLRPLGQLADHVDEVTAQIRRHIPERVAMDSRLLKVRSSHDELYRIAQAVKALTERVYLNADLTRQWTAQMAHELKTPLTLLRVEVDSLRGKSEGVDAEQVDFLLGEIDRLNQVISSFLDWAEVESGLKSRTICSIDLAEVLEKAVVRLRQIYPDHRLSVVVRHRTRVLAEPLHMEQLICNLIDNALKYSGSQGVVEVGLCSRCFRVTDSGPGLPPEVMKRLGSPFNYPSGAKGSSSPLRSSGLGLAWVYSIARKYGWQLELHSSPQGTVVEVTFAQNGSAQAQV